MTNRVPRYDFDNDGSIDSDIDNSDTRAENLVATIRSILPVYGDLDAAPQDEGGVVYVTNQGGDAAGVYAWNEDNSEWDGPLTSNANQYSSLSDGSGVVVPVAKDINLQGQNATDVTINDDGDDSGTIYISSTDSQTDVSDADGLVVQDANNITVRGQGASSVDVSEDSNGDVDITVESTDSDTHTDISDVSGTVVSDTGNLTVTGSDAAGVSVEPDGDGGTILNIGVSTTGSEADTRTDVSGESGVVQENTNNINITGSGGADVSVTEDGSGGVNLDIGAPEPATSTDVSDSDGVVASDVSDITFVDSGATTLSVSDDGDGTATIEIDSTDTNTHASLADESSTVLEDPDEVSFEADGAADVAVSDDGDGTGTVTISATDTDQNTDTHVDVSDASGGVLEDVDDLTFTASDAADISVSDDGDGTATIEVSATDTNDTVSDTRVDIGNETSTIAQNADRLTLTGSGVADVNVTSDGSGGADVDISVADGDTNTHTSVSDQDGQVVDSVEDITFTASGGNSMSVSDDGDGSVTVNVESTNTDTRTDVSDVNGLVQPNVENIGFSSSGSADVSVGSDGSGGVNVEISSEDTDNNTQLSDEEVRDVVGAMVQASGDISVSYNDSQNTLVIDGSDTDTHITVTDGSTSVEDPDTLSFEGGGASNVSITEDGNGTGTVTVESTDTNDNTQLSEDEVQDIVGTFVNGSGSVSVSYDDSNGSLVIDGSDQNTQLTDEQVQDIVGAFVTGGDNTNVSYDDSSGSLVVSSTDNDTQLSEEEVRDAIQNSSPLFDTVQLSNNEANGTPDNHGMLLHDDGDAGDTLKGLYHSNDGSWNRVYTEANFTPHEQYTDNEARSAIDGGSISPSSVSGVTYLNADMSGSEVRSAINSSSTGDVFVCDPDGSWDIDQTLEPARGIKIEGNTPLDQTQDPTFRKTFDGPLLRTNHYGVYDNVYFEGNRENGYTGDIIEGDSSSSQHFTRCRISGGEGNGVYTNLYFSNFTSCWIILNGGYGMYWPSTSEDSDSTDNPHISVDGPSYIGKNDNGGIYFNDVQHNGKNIQIHAWIGKNGGPGITSDGTVQSLDVMAQFIENDGPIWLQEGGSMMASLTSPVVVSNCQNPDGNLSGEPGQIHVEDGSLHATIRQPWVVTNQDSDFIRVPSSDTSTFSIFNTGGTTIDGDITGSARLAITDLSGINGSVDVDNAVALDSSTGSVKVGSTLSESLGGGGFSQNGGIVASIDSSQTVSNPPAQIMLNTIGPGSPAGGRDLELNTSSGLIDITSDGTYDIEAVIKLDNPSNGIRWQTRININGNQSFVADRRSRGGSYDTQRAGLTSILSSGDTVGMTVYHAEGSPLDVVDTQDDTHLRVRRVA